MPDLDIIYAKTGNIQRCFKRIRDVTHMDPESLEDLDKQDIFVLNLQRAVEATIDIAAHVVASEGLGFASTIRENFKFLHQADIIDQDLSERMQAMVGFRNIAVHDYQSLNTAILKAIMEKHLKDIEEFYSLILHKFDRKNLD